MKRKVPTMLHDADTAIINAEGGNSGMDDKKEYFI